MNDSVIHRTKCCKKNTLKNLKNKVNKILKYSKNNYCYVNHYNHFIDEQTFFVMKNDTWFICFGSYEEILGKGQ